MFCCKLDDVSWNSNGIHGIWKFKGAVKFKLWLEWSYYSVAYILCLSASCDADSVQITTADESFATYQLVHNFPHLLLPLLFACCRCQYSFLCFLDSGVLLMQVQGFVTNMSEWMAACDCIITKVSSLSQLLLLVFIRLVLVFSAWHKLQKLEDTSLGLHPAQNQDVSRSIQDSPLFPAKFHNLQSAWSLQSQSLQTQIPAWPCPHWPVHI